MHDHQFPQCWAIEPARLATLQALHGTHLRDAVEQFANPASAAPARPAGGGRDMRPQRYAIHDGVAVVPVRGVLTPRTSWLAGFVETTALDAFTHAVRAAAADPQAKALMLIIDSPGGAVAGVQAAARAVRALRGTKPVGALVEDAALAGAYWIASAADPGAVWISADTSQVGAIGAVAAHVDISAREGALGLTHTEVVAGQYKAIASPHRPLTEAGRASLQQQVDAIYRVFVEDIATHRGVSVQRVLDGMADGRVFLGDQAVSAGLVDARADLDTALATLRARPAGAARPAPTRPTRPGARTVHAAGSPPAPRSFPLTAGPLPMNTTPTLRPTITSAPEAQPPRLDPTDSVAVDAAARAYQLKHPGTDYIAAVRTVTSAGSIAAPKGFTVDPELAALDEAAKAYQASHPGVDYITAVRTVERSRAARAVNP